MTSTRVVRRSVNVRLQQRHANTVRTQRLIHTASRHARTLLQTLASAASYRSKRTLFQRHRNALCGRDHTPTVCTADRRERGTHGQWNARVCKETVSVPTGERRPVHFRFRVAEASRTVVERVDAGSVKTVVYSSTPHAVATHRWILTLAWLLTLVRRRRATAIQAADRTRHGTPLDGACGRGTSSIRTEQVAVWTLLDHWAEGRVRDATQV